MTELEKINKELGTNLNEVDWYRISVYQKLSEKFIRENSDKINWNCISRYQKLSESFIRENSDKVNWGCISKYQKLSESFIRENSDKVNWGCISIYQKLSEKFIREYSDKVDWYRISVYQKLSEKFIRENSDKLDWDWISQYQKLSESFIKKNSDKININENNWLYKNTEFKKNKIKECDLYECFDDYFIGYKGIRSDRYSNYNFQYQYLKGNIYESHCDHSSNENSFGLSVWTEARASEYCNELVVKVKVKYEDVGRLVHNSNKIRCTRIEILS